MTLFRKRSDIDMTNGPFLGKIIAFIIPLCLTHILQNLYHAADLAVIGQFRGDTALAAIGSTSSLNSMLVSLFIGISAGAGVMAAQYIGAKDDERLHHIVHSSVLLALTLGLVGGLLFFVSAPLLLRWIDVPENIFSQSLLYIRIIFFGFPASMLYNYCAAIVRASGDSKHPLIYLTVSGVTNVALNLLLVLVFGYGVEGVAIATISSQYLSATLMLIHLFRQKGALHFSPRRLRFDRFAVRNILYIGVPMGVQNTVFNLANVMVQASVNAFGDIAIAGNTAACNLENFPYVAMGSVNQAAVTFVGQNVGARRHENVRRITRDCLLITIVIGAVGAGTLLLFREFFVGLYADSAAAMEIAFKKMFFNLPFFPLVGVMEVLNSELRSMGKSVSAMCISLTSACAVRILWIQLMTRLVPDSIEIVFSAHPASHVVGFAANVIVFTVCYKKFMRTAKGDTPASTM